MPKVKLGNKGLLQLPEEVQHALDLHQGDQVEIIITKDKEAIIKPVTATVDEVFGMLHKYSKKHVSIEDMNDGIKKAVKGKFK